MFNLYVYIVGIIAFILAIFLSYKYNSKRTVILTALLSSNLSMILTEIVLFPHMMIHDNYVSLFILLGSLAVLFVVLSFSRITSYDVIEKAILSTFITSLAFILPVIITMHRIRNFTEYFSSVENVEWTFMFISGLIIRYLITVGLMGIVYYAVHYDTRRHDYAQITFVLSLLLTGILGIQIDDYERDDFSKAILAKKTEIVLKDAYPTRDFGSIAFIDDEYIYYDWFRGGIDETQKVYVKKHDEFAEMYEFDRFEYSEDQTFYHNNRLYFVANNSLFAYNLETVEVIYTNPDLEKIHMYALYLDNDQLYLEGQTEKLLISENTYTVVTDYKSIFEDALDVYSLHGNLFIDYGNSISVNGINYNIKTEIRDLQVFGDYITNGEYEFIEGKAKKIGDLTAKIFEIDGKYYRQNPYYYRLFNLTNIHNRFDVLKRSYSMNKVYSNNEKGYNLVYVGHKAEIGVTNTIIDVQHIYDYQKASPVFLVTSYIFINILFFSIKRRTYRNR